MSFKRDVGWSPGASTTLQDLAVLAKKMKGNAELLAKDLGLNPAGEHQGYRLYVRNKHLGSRLDNLLCGRKTAKRRAEACQRVRTIVAQTYPLGIRKADKDVLERIEKSGKVRGSDLDKLVQKAVMISGLTVPLTLCGLLDDDNREHFNLFAVNTHSSVNLGYLKEMSSDADKGDKIEALYRYLDDDSYLVDLEDAMTDKEMAEEMAERKKLREKVDGHIADLQTERAFKAVGLHIKKLLAERFKAYVQHMRAMNATATAQTEPTRPTCRARTHGRLARPALVLKPSAGVDVRKPTFATKRTTTPTAPRCSAAS
jgi:hypothetical protein